MEITETEQWKNRYRIKFSKLSMSIYVLLIESLFIFEVYHFYVSRNLPIWKCISFSISESSKIFYLCLFAFWLLRNLLPNNLLEDDTGISCRYCFPQNCRLFQPLVHIFQGHIISGEIPVTEFAEILEALIQCLVINIRQKTPIAVIRRSSILFRHFHWSGVEPATRRMQTIKTQETCM